MEDAIQIKIMTEKIGKRFQNRLYSYNGERNINIYGSSYFLDGYDQSTKTFSVWLLLLFFSAEFLILQSRLWY